MEKKNVVFLTVLAVATLLTAVVGTTFAYFTATITNKDSGTESTITAATIGAEYSEGTGTLATSTIMPGYKGTKSITVSAPSTNTQATNYQIYVNYATTNSFVNDQVAAVGTSGEPGYQPAINECNIKLYYSTTNFISGITASSTDSEVQTAVSGIDSLDLCSDSTGNKIAAGKNILFDNQSVPASGSDNFYALVYFKNASYVQNANQGKSFTLKFGADAINQSV